MIDKVTRELIESTPCASSVEFAGKFSDTEVFKFLAVDLSGRHIEELQELLQHIERYDEEVRASPLLVSFINRGIGYTNSRTWFRSANRAAVKRLLNEVITAFTYPMSHSNIVNTVGERPLPNSGNEKMNTEYTGHIISKPFMTITPLPQELDWELTTQRSIDSVVLTCAIGSVEVAGGWSAIEKDCGWVQSKIGETLAENIQVCQENFIEPPQGRNFPELNREVFKGLSLHDFTCTEINPRTAKLEIKVKVECFLEVCAWLKDIGMNEHYFG